MTSRTSTYKPTETLDVKGLSCPISVVKTRGAVDELEGGEILQIVAADSDSMNDLRGWADAANDVVMLDQEGIEEDGDVAFCHFIQKE